MFIPLLFETLDRLSVFRRHTNVRLNQGWNLGHLGQLVCHLTLASIGCKDIFLDLTYCSFSVLFVLKFFLLERCLRHESYVDMRIQLENCWIQLTNLPISFRKQDFPAGYCCHSRHYTWQCVTSIHGSTLVSLVMCYLQYSAELEGIEPSWNGVARRHDVHNIQCDLKIRLLHYALNQILVTISPKGWAVYLMLRSIHLLVEYG